ncbi:DUF1194 domain-containing protein [Yoonia sp. R2331]|uniref:DUF1194 domain-containing protein n=1 Tax=Yoonia sp. R2331 TaxID=3237238 RepID=UPI0034E494AB
MRMTVALCLWAGAAQAQMVETSLELVFLADGSGSIDEAELAFQRQGYADAIQSPEVLAAIADTAYGHIAVAYVEWAINQAVVAEWTLIDGPEAAAAFAAKLEGPRQVFGRNAIGAALLEGQRQIDINQFDGFRHVIDFSGDSIGNSNGPPIEEARQEVLSRGTVINALPILRPDSGRRAGANLEAEYQARIIGGPGAFMVTAESRETFGAAVQRKIFLEISGQMPGVDVALVE